MPEASRKQPQSPTDRLKQLRDDIGNGTMLSLPLPSNNRWWIYVFHLVRHFINPEHVFGRSPVVGTTVVPTLPTWADTNEMVALLTVLERQKPPPWATLLDVFLCMHDTLDPAWSLSLIIRSTLRTLDINSLPKPEGRGANAAWHKRVSGMLEHIKDLWTFEEMEGALTSLDRIAAWAGEINSPTLARGRGPHYHDEVRPPVADRALQHDLGPSNHLRGDVAPNPRSRHTEPRRSGIVSPWGPIDSAKPAATSSPSTAEASTGLGAAAARSNVTPPVNHTPVRTALRDRAYDGAVPYSYMRRASDTILSPHHARASDPVSQEVSLASARSVVQPRIDFFLPDDAPDPSPTVSRGQRESQRHTEDMRLLRQQRPANEVAADYGEENTRSSAAAGPDVRGGLDRHADFPFRQCTPTRDEITRKKCRFCLLEVHPDMQWKRHVESCTELTRRKAERNPYRLENKSADSSLVSQAHRGRPSRSRERDWSPTEPYPSVRQPGCAHTDTFRGEAACLRDVRQGVRAHRWPHYAHADAFRGDALCLRDVRQGVLNFQQPD